MNTPFDIFQDVIIVQVHLWGPTADVWADFILDTGASKTVVSATVLSGPGYDLKQVSSKIRVTTASGAEFLPRVSLFKLETLGGLRDDFSVLAHTLPSSADIDGLLGLDFIRSQDLLISYRTGTLTLS